MNVRRYQSYQQMSVSEDTQRPQTPQNKEQRNRCHSPPRCGRADIRLAAGGFRGAVGKGQALALAPTDGCRPKFPHGES